MYLMKLNFQFYKPNDKLYEYQMIEDLIDRH